MILFTFVVGFLWIFILLLSLPSSSFILSIHLLASSILLVFLPVDRWPTGPSDRRLGTRDEQNFPIASHLAWGVCLLVYPLFIYYSI